MKHGQDWRWRPHPLDTARELLVLVDHVLDGLDGQVHHLLGAHAWGKEGFNTTLDPILQPLAVVVVNK